MPLFVGAVGYLVALLISPIELFRGVEYADLQTRVIYWVVSGSIAILISAFAFRLLARKKFNWSPADIPGFVIAGTLLLIEFCVSRVLHKREAADD
ncbi:hypothetical protein D3C81_1711560 [compost metagenome]